MTRRLSVFEWIMLSITALILILGIISSNISVEWFEQVYVVEDGLIENWTVVPLLIAAFYALKRLFSLKDKSIFFKVCLVFIAVFSIFVAGEEISWGQRIFNIESSDFFLENNAQQETNLHNMVVGGKKVNKIIFSQLMTIAMIFYLLILPFWTSRSDKVLQFVNRLGVPLARNYQIFACVILFVGILAIPTGKNAEVLEAGITSLFLLIFLYPKNEEIYKS